MIGTGLIFMDFLSKWQTIWTVNKVTVTIVIPRRLRFAEAAQPKKVLRI